MEGSGRHFQQQPACGIELTCQAAKRRAEIAALDRLSETRGGPSRFDTLARTFREAARLEAAFWDMGLDG